MKKSILPTLVGFACIIAFFLFSGLECNDKDPVDPGTHCLYFRSYKITWRPTPVDNLDRALSPGQHANDMIGSIQYYSYYLDGLIDKVCMKEATIVDFRVEIKEEFKNEIIVMGNVEHNDINFDVNNWNYSTANGIYHVSGSVTINGDPTGEETRMTCGFVIAVNVHTDLETTSAFFNNVVNMIQLDWAYTEY